MRSSVVLAFVLACRSAPGEAAPASESAARPVPASTDAGAPARGPAPRRTGASPDRGTGVPPMADTPADALETATHRHVEVLRIDRDFGKPHFDIVIDAWVPKDAPDQLADARIWWLKRHRDDMRGPFGRKSLRHVEVETERLGPDRMRIAIGAKGTRFAFEVVDDGAGRVRAYARVRTSDGRTVERCAARSGRLVAKKILGIVRGIDRLEVACRAPDGETVRGVVVPGT